MADDPNRCAVCRVRSTRPRAGTMADAFCSTVCEQSSDAEVKRYMERDRRFRQ